MYFGALIFDIDFNIFIFTLNFDFGVGISDIFEIFSCFNNTYDNCNTCKACSDEFFNNFGRRFRIQVVL